MMPTVAPTFYPTAIPTYTISVQIYVIIGHQLVGISSSEYDRAKYDALLQTTICASIPYITDPRDVSMLSIQPFSQVAGTRCLGNTTVDSILMTYTITMSSNLFPSSIAGITGVVNTLNNSITTGFFDDYLHKEAYTANVTALKMVTSRLQSFQTSSPTSTP
jgi:predicted anti-sigma-YlaC factor YlaD